MAAVSVRTVSEEGGWWLFPEVPVALHSSAAQGIILCTRELLLSQPPGDASERRIRATACDQLLVSVDHAWDLGMNALQMAVL